MGRYDDITPDELRRRMVGFARLVLRLEEKGTLLAESPTLLKLLGELRQMLFAWEVRGTRRLEPSGEEPAAAGEAGTAGEAAAEEEDGDPTVQDSLRIVREALERERDLLDEIEGRSSDGDS